VCLTKGGIRGHRVYATDRKWIESRAKGLYASGVSGDVIYGDEAFVAWAFSIPRRPMARPKPGTVRAGYVEDLDRSRMGPVYTARWQPRR
jgi:hypothetical protein